MHTSVYAHILFNRYTVTFVQATTVCCVVCVCVYACVHIIMDRSCAYVYVRWKFVVYSTKKTGISPSQKPLLAL